MSDDYNWRRDRDRSRRDDDRDWYRRTEDYRREGTGWGRGRDEREPWRETYGRDATDRDWSTRGRDRTSRGSDDWNRDRGRDEGGGRYGRQDWGRDYGRDPRYGGMMGPAAAGGGWGFSEEYGRDPGWDYGMSSGYPRGGYPRDDYGRDRYGYNERRGYGRSGPQDRGFWDRASDEVSSWFGDEDADRRRREDARRDMHRGRGPRGYTRSDDRIREDVSDRLTDNPILDATEIEVVVVSGEVTLSGRVDSRYSKRLAEDVAEDVSGVQHVQNNLRVRDAAMPRSGNRFPEPIRESARAERHPTSAAPRARASAGSSGLGNTERHYQRRHLR